MLTLPDPAFQQSGRKRIALQHWATTVVPAEAGDHDLHLPCQFKMLFLSSSVYFFPYNVLREVFLGETVHQICLSYTRWVYFEDGRVSTFCYLNFCTSQWCLMQIWQLQEINLVCWQCRPWWALRKKENAARFGNSFQVFWCSAGSSVLLLYCSGMTLAIYEWRESFVEFDPTSCYTTAKAVSYLLFLHSPAISLIRHQISHLANSLLCWPAALGVTAHLVKRKLWFCTSAKDRRGPSKLSQATERLVRWLTLHLHCHSDLFPLFLPKTPGTTPLWGKNESIIHRMRENSPTCF